MSQFRIARGEIPIVFLGSMTFQQRPIFRNDRNASLLIDALRYYEQRGDIQLHAFCVMPNHYHTVVELMRVDSVSQVIHRTHSLFVELLRREDVIARKQRVWSRRTWDVWIRNEDMYWQKIAYTLLNPWRAGLVPTPLSPYPLSNIEEWREQYGDDFLLDLFGRYARYGE